MTSSSPGYGSASDDDTHDLIDDALAELARRRGSWIGDDITAMTLIASLIEQAERFLPQMVTNARLNGHSWDEIARGISTSPRKPTCGSTPNPRSPTPDGPTTSSYWFDGARPETASPEPRMLSLLRQHLTRGFPRRSLPDPWNLRASPSGHLEAGESVVQGVIREAREEVGVLIDPADLAFSHVVHHRNPQGQARIGFFFTAARWQGEPVNREPHKCAGLYWADLAQPPANTVPYTAAALAAITQGAPFSLHGW